MKRLAIIAAFLALPAAPLRADPPAKITVRQAISIAQALRNLDGHMIVTKQNGADQTVMIPWEFGSGSLRLRIANNLSIVAAVETSFETARKSVIKEIGGTSTPNPGTPEYETLLKQLNEVLDQPAAGSQDLARIKASELKLDKNEIPITVISALEPILDNDVR